MELTKETMPETMYRSSRFCRILGNPTAYLILRLLDKSSMTVNEIAAAVNIEPTTISATLRNLRNIDVVRYITIGQEKAYWLKDQQILEILDSIECWVDEVRRKTA